MHGRYGLLARADTTSSGGSCQDVYGICASPIDCCSGLACTNGVCR
ncbi:MAG: hypothetical protein JST00_41825 [Deltaproteobacteria bacterium]|nr:hypothetical protein [Deltaproteobacteria bacterium]